MEGRHFLAISIKHSEFKWRFGSTCWLWGTKRTADAEKRCFSGYTLFPENAELYTLEEFREYYPFPWIKTDEPIHMCIGLMKKYRKFDTVLVDYDEYINYCKMSGHPTKPI